MAHTGKLIVITPDDTIETKDYVSYESISDAVNGSFEHLHSMRPEDADLQYSINVPIEPILSVDGKSEVPVDLFCNDEFLVDSSEEFDKINAVASQLLGQEIRGNVVALVYEGGGENRGFEYKEYTEVEGAEPEEDLCECWGVEDTLLKYINSTKENLQELHKQYDNNKSEPRIEFMYGE